MNQAHLPVEVRFEDLALKKSLGDAIQYCAERAGFQLDKELSALMGVDKGQFSRWHSGVEGIMWPKFAKLMDACGNDAPVLWMLGQRGYDLHSLRKLESVTEKQNRMLREENAALRRVLMGATV